MHCTRRFINDLRNESLQRLMDIDFDGYAIGGLAVGETQKEMFDTVRNISDKMPRINQDILWVWVHLQTY